MVEDVLRLFELYEPSRIITWEIIRTFHPYHVSALLFLLENLQTTKHNSLEFNTNCDSFILIDGFIVDYKSTPICKKTYTPTLNLNQVNVIREKLSPNPIKTYNLERINNKLTIIGLLKIIMGNKTNKADLKKVLSISEQIAFHNLTTKNYKLFLSNFSSFLTSDDMQSDRNEIYKIPLSITDKFFQYYMNISCDSAIQLTMSSKSMRCINRPYFKKINVLTNNCFNENTILQPLYRGFRLVLNSYKTGQQKMTTRCYNIHGELMHNLLNNIDLNIDGTFEVVLLPLDKSGKIRSWNYWKFKHSFILILTDAFRIESHYLCTYNYEKRYELARLAIENKANKTTNKLQIIPKDLTITDILQHNTKLDYFNPVSGVVFREKNGNVMHTDNIYLFNTSTCYNYLTDKLENITGNISVRNYKLLHFPLNCVDYRITLCVYSHDDDYLYSCYYNREQLCFLPHLKLPRFPDTPNPTYKSINLYIKHKPNTISVYGVAFIRVYHDSYGTVVGYEEKLTSSMYDIPYNVTNNNTLYLNANLNSIGTN